MDTAKAMNYKDLHLNLLRIFYQVAIPITPKEIISKFAIDYGSVYKPEYNQKKENKITNAIIYSAIKYLEKEKLIQRSKSSAKSFKKATPFYSITEDGKDLLRQTISLNIENLLSFFVTTLLREKIPKLEKMGLSSKVNLALIGPQAPIGNTLLSIFSQQRKDPLIKHSSAPIFFFKYEPLLAEKRKLDTQITSEEFEKPNYSHTNNIIFRNCKLDKNGALKLDIGNEEVEFIISIMLLSSFPNNIDATFKELYRVLKPNGILVLHEMNLEGSITLWILQNFTQKEIAIFPDLLFALLTQKGANSPMKIEQSLVDIFGNVIDSEHFKEADIFYVKKIN